MSVRQVPAGLGIDVTRLPSATAEEARPPDSRSAHKPAGFEGRAVEGPFPVFAAAGATALPASVSETSGMRSARGMQGLLRAESGEVMVQFDDEGFADGPSFRDGRRIALDNTPQPGDGVPRVDTILNFGGSPEKSAAELRTLLGNANARLKPGAAVAPPPGQSSPEKKNGKTRAETVSLEQAKPRARVDVDIILESNACVQGDNLLGQIKLRIRKKGKKQGPILLAGGKVRVIGFECISNDDDRHTFYQCASSLSSVTGGLQGVYDSPPDSEGFAEAIEGIHTLPFSMHLPVDGPLGAAKGVVSLHSGVAIQYIAMVSIKVKDSKTGKRSIAHFYRNCEIWPRLNPMIVLAPAPRPLQACTAKSLSMLNSSNKVKLTALLPRLTWLAGQRCYVRVSVVNETKKTIKSLSLTLVRSTTVFRPRPTLDAGRTTAVDPDACQTSTVHKVVGETVLEMSQRSGRGHASAKGWWTGVGPGQELDFSHYILIPPDALSVVRSRLLEVEYAIRVTLSAGSLTADVSVVLPVGIVNFLSLDPPPSVPALAPSGSCARRAKRRRSIDGELSESGTVLSSAWSELSHPARPRPRGASSQDPRGDSYSSSSSFASNSRARGGPVRRQSDLRVTNPDSYAAEPSAFVPLSESDGGSVYSSDYASATSYSDSSAMSHKTRDYFEVLAEEDEDAEFVVIPRNYDAIEVDVGADTGVGYAHAWTSDASSSRELRTKVTRPSAPRWESSEYFERGRTNYPISSTQSAVRHGQSGGTNARNGSAFPVRVEEKLALLSTSPHAGTERIVDGDTTPRISAGPSAACSPVRETRAFVPAEDHDAIHPSISSTRAARGLPYSSRGTSLAAAFSSDSESEVDAGSARYRPRATVGTMSDPPSREGVRADYVSPRCFGTPGSTPPPRPPRARRPTDGIMQTGISTGSVQGRIADLEERVRSVQGGGPIYV